MYVPDKTIHTQRLHWNNDDDPAEVQNRIVEWIRSLPATAVLDVKRYGSQTSELNATWSTSGEHCYPADDEGKDA